MFPVKRTLIAFYGASLSLASFVWHKIIVGIYSRAWTSAGLAMWEPSTRASFGMPISFHAYWLNTRAADLWLRLRLSRSLSDKSRIGRRTEDGGWRTEGVEHGSSVGQGTKRSQPQAEALPNPFGILHNIRVPELSRAALLCVRLLMPATRISAWKCMTPATLLHL